MMMVYYTSNHFLATLSDGAFWGLGMSPSFMGFLFTECALIVLISKLRGYSKNNQLYK